MKIADVCFFYNNVLHVGWLLISSIFHEGELLVYYWCHQSSKILYHIKLLPPNGKYRQAALRGRNQKKLTKI